MLIDFCILTMSSKNKGRCVVGIDCTNQRLIRLVSDDQSSDFAIPNYLLDLRNVLAPSSYIVNHRGNAELSIMDIVTVDIKKEVPHGWQTENVLIDTRKKWKISERAYDLSLIINPYVSNFNMVFGTRECFLYPPKIISMNYSLQLSCVHDIEIYKNQFGKQKIDFMIGYTYYKEMSMTDPLYYTDSKVFIKKALVVFSLPNNPVQNKHNPDDIKYYKFASSIIPLQE